MTSLCCVTWDNNNHHNKYLSMNSSKHSITDVLHVDVVYYQHQWLSQNFVEEGKVKKHLKY